MRARYKSQTIGNENRIWIFRQFYWGAWQRPRYSSGSGGKCGSPIVLVLKQTLMSVYGKTECEAFSTPLRVALWDHIGWMEREGMTIVPPPIDPSIIEAMKAVAKDAVKQWEAWKAKQPRSKA